jgi:hypothetical protein
LARFENAWLSLPHVVSRGAQKNFIHFMDAIGERPDGWEPATEEFRRTVAKGIFFKQIQSIVRRSEKVTAYQINVSAYTAALVADRTARRVDLDRIWRDQGISPALVETIEAWAPVVFLHLPDYSRKEGRNTEESFKSQACWDTIRQLDLRVQKALESELVTTVPSGNGVVIQDFHDDLNNSDHNNIAICRELSERQWLAVSTWGQARGTLEEWQRGLARTLAGYAAEGWKKMPSKKQAKHGARMVEASRKEGVLDLA